MGIKERNEIKDNSKALGLSNWKGEDKKAGDRGPGEEQERDFGHFEFEMSGRQLD